MEVLIQRTNFKRPFQQKKEMQKYGPD